MKQSSGPVLAHDYVTQRGGAERVALALTRIYPSAPLVTALYNESTSFPEFDRVNIQPSWLNRLAMFRRNPQLALPFLHYAWALRSRVNGPAVLASSSGWAHGVRVAKDTAKVVYCHNPPRWIHQSDDYLMGRSGAVRLLLKLMKPQLRRWDLRAARTADLYVANSTSVAKRIAEIYGVDARVVHPPVMIDPNAEQVRPAELPVSFFLTVGRKRGYKGTSEVVGAFARLPNEHLVTVGGSVEDSSENVTVLNGISDAALRWLYANATALVSVSREDFGLTPLEANAFGTPALLVRAGGFLDSLAEGVSGLYLRDATVDGIVDSVQNFPRNWDREAIRAHAARFSPQVFEEKINEAVETAIAVRSAERAKGRPMERSRATRVRS